MRPGRRICLVMVGLLVNAWPAAAQDRSWDAAVQTGVWWGRPQEESAPGYGGDRWFTAWLGSASLGRYWTPHVKTELDATFTSDATRYVAYQVRFPGERTPRYVAADQHHQERSVAALVTFQAGRNWWVHPFMQGGVSVDWDRVRVLDFPGFSFEGPLPDGRGVGPAPDGRSGAETRVNARAVAAGGAKFYVNERWFFRADVRTTFGADGRHVLLRTGLGVDF